MLRSKATAALMRLKEIDRKYNIKGKRPQSNVSTDSSIEDMLRNPQPDFRISSNNNPDVARIKDADASPNKVSPRSRSKASSILAWNGNVLENETGPKRSPRNSPDIRAKTVALEQVSEESPKASNPVRNSEGSNFDMKDEAESSDSEVSSAESIQSSVATVLSQPSENSEIISEVIGSVEESFSRRTPRTSAPPRDTGDFLPLNTNDYEELMRMSEDKSEIVSERSETTINNPSNVSSKEEQRVQYESDTFEEASSSSSFAEESARKSTNEEVGHSTVRSGVKEIKITPHKQIEGVAEEEKVVDDDRCFPSSPPGEKEIIELVAPKAMQSTSECDVGLDEELSNYVKTMENVESGEVLPVSLLKSPRQASPTKKQARRNRKQRKASIENTAEAQGKATASDQEKLARRKESCSTVAKSIEQKDNDYPTTGQSATGPAEAEVKREAVDMEAISSDKLLREVPKKSDVTDTLRQLHREAIDAVRGRRRDYAARRGAKKSGPCRKCGATVKLPAMESDSVQLVEGKESGCGSMENARMHVRGRKSKCRRMSKPCKGRRGGKPEERFDCRQMHRLRRQAAALRLQQERDDIRNYLLELERTRLEFGPGEWTGPSELAAFRPLQFPKIATFQKPELEDANSLADRPGELQERLLTIRQWLKDQYILYRDYSSLARTVNAKYIPASLEDAKKTIRQLQRAMIKTR